MKIKFNLDCIKPMIDWLLESKKNNVRDENKLREILNMSDYKLSLLAMVVPIFLYVALI